MSSLNTTKHTFEAHLAQKQADKHNSDLANLAQAHEYVTAAISELERLKRNILDTATKIEEGAVVSVEEVRRLYEEARSAGVSL